MGFGRRHAWHFVAEVDPPCYPLPPDLPAFARDSQNIA